MEEIEEANQAQPQLLEVPPPEKDKSPGRLSQRSDEEFDLNREQNRIASERKYKKIKIR